MSGHVSDRESSVAIRFRPISAAVVAVLLGSCGGGGDGGGTPTEPVTIKPPDNTVASVVVAGTAIIAPGGSSQLTATPLNAAGAPVSGLTTTWSSATTSVATVNSGGLVTAVANGTSMITATISGKAGLLQVTVQDVTFSTSASVTVANSSFSPGQVDVAAGATVTWNFTDPIDHTVNFTGAGSPENIPASNSKSVSRSFPAAGTYPYECAIHYGMTGTVVVH
jgi:plastocyanin